MQFVKPEPQQKELAYEFKRQFPRKYEIPGGCGLESVNYYDWVLQTKRMRDPFESPGPCALVYFAMPDNRSEIIGVVTMQLSVLPPKGGHISLTVAPKFRSVGNGSLILCKALDAYEKMGYRRVRVICPPDAAGLADNNGGTRIRDGIYEFMVLDEFVYPAAVRLDGSVFHLRVCDFPAITAEGASLEEVQVEGGRRLAAFVRSAEKPVTAPTDDSELCLEPGEFLIHVKFMEGDVDDQ